MDTLSATITMLVSAADIMFNFWWLVVFGPIGAKTRRGRKRNTLAEILALWIFMAVIRVLLVFNPNPFRPFLLPEPINTIVFVLTGVGLFALYLLIRQR